MSTPENQTPSAHPAHLPQPELAAGLKADHFLLARTDGSTSGMEHDPAQRLGPDERSAAWLRAVSYGFYQTPPTQDQLKWWVEGMINDGVRATTVLPEPAAEGAEASYGLGATFPVGTFCAMKGSFNAGKVLPADSTDSPLIPALMCTNATVNPGYRRRGILRYMMTEAMRYGADEGMAVSLLTATEATIYQRFGYGVATRVHAVEVSVGTNFLAHLPDEGRSFTADPAKLHEVLTDLQSTLHRNNSGSVSELKENIAYLSGQASAEDYTRRCGNKVNLRAAVHCDEQGVIDGCVIYVMEKPETGFSHTAAIQGLFYTSISSYLQLWKFLGSLDLVEKVTWASAPVRDALTTVLADPRDYKITGQKDRTWLRVLNLPQAVAGRGFGADFRCVVRIDDPIGFTHGDWLISVENGEGRAEPITELPKNTAVLSMKDHVFASLFSGDVDLRVFLGTGQIHYEANGSKLTQDELNSGFRLVRRPYSMTYF